MIGYFCLLRNFWTVEVMHENKKENGSPEPTLPFNNSDTLLPKSLSSKTGMKGVPKTCVHKTNVYIIWRKDMDDFCCEGRGFIIQPHCFPPVDSEKEIKFWDIVEFIIDTIQKSCSDQILVLAVRGLQGVTNCGSIWETSEIEILLVYSTCCVDFGWCILI